jgi:DNA-binding PadR family transcriptional regulator
MFGFGHRHGRDDREGCSEGGRCHGREHKHRDDDGPRGFFGHGRGPRGFDGEGRGRRGGPMGRGRFFDHGDLKLLILALVGERPRHGYEIIKDIEEKVAGAYSPSPGVVYPTLTLLEELGYITTQAAAGNRKLSQITEAGQEFLDANEAAVKVIFARMEAAGKSNESDRSPQLVRAMENLKLAMRLKLASGALSAEQLNTIAAALDEAVGKIERS